MRIKKMITSTLLVLAIVMSCFMATATTAIADTDTGVTFHFINVNNIDKYIGGSGSPIGSADCILIQDDGVNILVDCGTAYENSVKTISDYLTAKGVTTIDHLFLTHPHDDHYGGVPGIVAAFNVKKAYYTTPADWERVRPCEIDWSTKYYSDLAIKAISEKVNYTGVENDGINGTGIEIIHPDREGMVVEISPTSYFTIYNCLAVVKNNFREPEFNDFSMYMKYTYKPANGADPVNALLTGDVNIQYEYVVSGQVMPDGTRCAAGTEGAVAPAGECEIFELPHHGTEGSLSSANFFASINPNNKNCLAVITGYRSNVGASVSGRCSTYKYDLRMTHYGDQIVQVNTDGTYGWVNAYSGS